MSEEQIQAPSNEGGQPDSAATAASQHKPRQRRPSALLRDRGLQFVNKMRNVGFLAGYTQPGDNHSFLLQQTNNIEQAIRVEVGDQYAKLTRLPGRPVLAKVHVRGYRDEYGPQVSLHCIELDKPSLLDLPVDEVWASGFGHGKEAAKILGRLSRENFSPFDANGEVRPEYRELVKSADAEAGTFELDDRAKNFARAYKMLGEVLDASGGVVDSRLGRGQNYMSIAGFVDAKAWVPATEYRHEYALLMIRQHEDPEKNIPVRVIGKMAKVYFAKVKEGGPVLVEGSVRRKVIPDDADTTKIKSRHSYIETTRVSPGQVGVDILDAPAWWDQIRVRLLARRAEQEARRAQEKASADDAKRVLEQLGDQV